MISDKISFSTFQRAISFIETFSDQIGNEVKYHRSAEQFMLSHRLLRRSNLRRSLRLLRICVTAEGYAFRSDF